MRTITFVLFAVLLTVFAPSTDAQVTNLKIQNSTSSFTFVSGGTFGWEFDVPAGDTAYAEIWLDVNANGSIDPAADHLYLSFLQGDGVMDGLNGPPDLDGMANGHVTFQAKVGIAPGTFIMKFSDHGSGMQLPGTCTPLASPAHTISGKVTVPAGKSAQYILIEAGRSGSYNPNFWHAITNANGDYVVQMDADTAGGPWRVEINNPPFSGGVITPGERWVYPGLDPSGNDFTIELPAAKVAGVVMDDNGRLLPDCGVYLNRSNGGINRYANTDWTGAYEIGALGVELNGQTWFVQAGNGDPMTTNKLMAQRQLPVLHGGDSLYRQLVIYTVNSQIQGQVKINGSAPGFPVPVSAWNADTAQGATQTDGAGNFSIGVSDKIYTYQVFTFNMGPDYSGNQVAAHPGQSGVQINLTTTGIGEPGSAVPSRFALEQNYPNPFNPTTGIRYQVSGAGLVRLAVYNILGQEVATLVNEVKQPGIYTVQFDAANIPSGIYFYRMTANNFMSTKTMVVLK